MRLRAKKAKRARDEVREQVADLTDDLVGALDAAREAIARASAAAGRRGTELGAEAGRRGAKAGRRGARAAREAAREAARRLPEADQVGELSKRAADRLFPERARQRRRARRRRLVGMAGGIVGVVAGGLLALWLTVSRRGAEARQAAEDRAHPEQGGAAAPEAGEPGQVTQLHQGNGASTSSPTRYPPS
jgi:hypothetical protein